MFFIYIYIVYTSKYLFRGVFPWSDFRSRFLPCNYQENLWLASQITMHAVDSSWYDIQMFVAENCCESPRQAHTIIIQLDFLKYVHTPEYIKPGRSWKTYFLFFVVHRNSEKNRKRQGKRGKTSTPSRIKSPRRPYYTPYDTPVHFPPVLFVAFVYSPAATLLFRVE